jgi:hypothetical protein
MVIDPDRLPHPYVSEETKLQCVWCGTEFKHGDGMIPFKQPNITNLGTEWERPPPAVHPDGGETGLYAYHPDCYRERHAEKAAAENVSLSEFGIDIEPHRLSPEGV